jgi:hypothetical protein
MKSTHVEIAKIQGQKYLSQLGVELGAGGAFYFG